MQNKPFFVTTPIYYVNDAPHMGHAYTTIVADVLARYNRMFGKEVFLLTGTDEHGQKVEAAARALGLEPQEHVDRVVQRYKDIWDELDIEADFFIRTTMDFHCEAVQRCLQKLHDKGDIYTDEYEGWYSVSEEIFYTEKDLVDGKSPEGKEVEKVTETNYFFKMSAYQKKLIEYIKANPDFIRPEGKRSEVLGFLKKPLGDLCISRPKSRLSWGVEIPFDKDYVTYVWFDALLNYCTGIGYLQGGEKEEGFKKFWPEALHLLGKDILITHAVYWPTMLMALDIPLPKLFAHGWWLTEGGLKMSKSDGEKVTPGDIKELIGVDSLRYFLCRDINFGNDAKFSKDIVLYRVNAELANNLGNLLSRTLNLADKYYGAKAPDKLENLEATKKLIEEAKRTGPAVRESIDDISPSMAIGHVVELLSSTNRYIDSIAPWKAVKEKPEEAQESIYTALEVLRISAILLYPVMPAKMKQLLSQLGWEKEPGFADAISWGLLESGTTIIKGEPLFPRLDTKG